MVPHLDAAHPAATPPNRPAAALRLMRPAQWVKNLLLFVPLAGAHRASDAHLLLLAAGAFAAFCLCASGVYVFNDLFDLAADRAHPTKRARPLAAGAVTPAFARGLGAALLAAGLAAAFLTRGWPLALAAAVYVAISSAYTLYLKRVLALDVIVLAGLYTYRVLAGGLAVGVEVTPWLLAYSTFLFLSLAFAKRYTEVRRAPTPADEWVAGRSYGPGDHVLLGNLGPVSGYLSVLVFALYIDQSKAAGMSQLYRHPRYLWLICPLMLYWVTRLWFFAYRGALDDDPVVFALKDRVSYLVGLAVALVLVAAAVAPAGW